MKKKTPKIKKFGKNEETRVIKKKAPKFYPEEDVRHRLYSRKHKHKPTRLRSNITPGTVLILVSGPYRGHRVVFLKQLRSGLLLINGPFKINGVPLRRVNQAYVISTSTKINLSGVKIDEKKFNDKYFKPEKKKRGGAASKSGKAAKPAEKKADEKKPEDDKKADEKKADEKKPDEKKPDEKKKEKGKEKTKGKDLFAARPKSKKNRLTSTRIEDQKAVDNLLLPKIRAVPLLKKYLKSKFSLRKGQFPHLMRF